MARHLLQCCFLCLASLWLLAEQRAWIFARSAHATSRPEPRSSRRLRHAPSLLRATPEESLLATSASWTWGGEEVHYYAAGPSEGPPVLLIHGFGVSGLNYRKTGAALASEGYRVYALDLLGFGRSSKPKDRTYSLELWEAQVIGFCKAFAGAEEPWVLGGNSIGGIVAMGVASKARSGVLAGAFGGVRGLLLFNCAAGMNNKLVLTSYRTNWLEKSWSWLVFTLLDIVLAQESIARWGFEKLATKETVQTLLKQVYVNSDAVDDELVDDILAAAADENALSVFVKCLSGDPGVPPEKLADRVCCPVKMIWGDRDLLTPLGVGYGFFFRALAKLYPSSWSLSVVPAGHCPHDDAPEAVHAALLPWLSSLPSDAATKPASDVDIEEVLRLSFDADALERFDKIEKLKI